MKQSPFSFDSDQPFDPSTSCIAPSPHREARETSALAAIENATTKRKADQNTRILLLIRAAGEQGISDLEINRATGIPRSSICARRGYDLRTLIEPAAERYEDPKTHRTFTRWKLREAGR